MEENKNIYQKLFEVKKAGIKLQRDTKAFNYQYATLSQIQEKLSEVMQEQGLLVIHRVTNNSVHTCIVNKDDGKDFVESTIPMAEGTKAQDKGSEITYYRRYNLLSLLDLEVEDDDGKKAQDSKSATTKKAKYFNYEDLVAVVEAGNNTLEEIGKVIKEDGFTVSANAKKAIAEYVNTGEINKNTFFGK